MKDESCLRHLLSLCKTVHPLIIIHILIELTPNNTCNKNESNQPKVKHAKSQQKFHTQDKENILAGAHANRNRYKNYDHQLLQNKISFGKDNNDESKSTLEIYHEFVLYEFNSAIKHRKVQQQRNQLNYDVCNPC